MLTFMQTITSSGAGARLELGGSRPLLTTLANEVIENAKKYGFALVHKLSLSREEFAELVRCAGATAEHLYGTGTAELLDLNADPDPKKSVTGRAALPLHTDGLILENHPSFIILYCAQTDEEPGSGETEICDQKIAFQSMPERLKVLFEDKWEYLACDVSHFPASIRGKWVAISPIRCNADGSTSLNMALPFHTADANPAWSVRLSGKDEQASAPLFQELEDYFRANSAFYSHRWQTGDLLVLDNSRVLHGRSEIIKPGSRHLYRGQLQ